MKTNYSVIPVVGPSVEGEVDLPIVPGYEELMGVIEPLLGVKRFDAEHVRVMMAGHSVDMFIQQNGQALGLLRNNIATTIYRNHVLSRMAPGTDPEGLPDIVGPAVVFMRKVWF